MTTDWSELEHAYGEASDVPRILDALASDREAEREQGYCDLFGSLCHQGSVYSATLAAVPALVAIVDRPGYPDRAKLLAALARIADGQGEGIAMADVRARLAAARDVFLGWIERGTVEEKIHALGVLRGPEFATCSARIVDVARTDVEPVVRAAAWEALLRVAPRSLPEVVEADPAVALVADLCKLEAEGADAGPALVVRVAEELFGPPGDEVRDWAEDGYVAQPVQHCVAHMAAVDSLLVGALARRLVDTCEVAEANELAEALLDAIFVASEDPPSPRSLDVLTTKERTVLEALVQSEAAWGARAQNGNLLYALARRGLPSGFDARAELVTALGTTLRKRLVIVTPRQVPAAMDKAVLLGRASLADVPFAFMLRSSGLSEAIPEDPADFPPSLMADFERIRRPILALVVQNTCPVSSAAFYPQLSPAAFEQIARELDFEIVPPNLAHANDPFTDEEEEEEDDDDDDEADEPVVPPCTAYADLADDAKAALFTFAETLHAAGFSEAKASHATTQGMGEAGISVTPLAVGRRFGDLSNLEFGFHHDDDSGIFVRALVASRREGGTFTFRLFPSSPAFYAVLAAVDGSQEPSASMLPLASVTSRILVEQGRELFSIRPSDA